MQPGSLTSGTCAYNMPGSMNVKTKYQGFSITGKLLISLIFILSFLLNTRVANCQEQYRVIQTDKMPVVYMGFGSGINFHTGLIGVGVEVPVVLRLTFFGQAGLGSWGTKAGAGLRYYQDPSLKGSSFSAAYSRATGLTDFELEMEVEPHKRTEMVLLDLKRAGTLNLDYAYNIRIGKQSKLGLHAGYSMLLQSGDLYTVKSQHQLSDASRQVLRIMTPGGILLGISFMFGISS